MTNIRERVEKEEIWKDVYGFLGYKVSSFGRVKGKHEKILQSQTWLFTAEGSADPLIPPRCQNKDERNTLSLTKH